MRKDPPLKAIKQINICLRVIRAKNKNKARKRNRDCWGTISNGLVGEGFSEKVACEESLEKVSGIAGQTRGTRYSCAEGGQRRGSQCGSGLGVFEDQQIQQRSTGESGKDGAREVIGNR